MTGTTISREYSEVVNLDPPEQKITILRVYNYEATNVGVFEVID